MFFTDVHTRKLFKITNILMLLVLSLVAAFTSHNAFALDAKEKLALSLGENETRILALNKVVLKGDTQAMPYLQSLLDDAVKVQGEKLFLVTDEGAKDAVTDAEVTLPEDAEDIVN
ncbi:MAG TPA: hypothetical protein DCO68_06245, partial [Methylophilaceae bacterium]|nr:hypothetical protein [Methylophilaceae bacterium]HAJ71663.1 hypothetical protein [Methylophilaceae bacterium]